MSLKGPTVDISQLVGLVIGVLDISGGTSDQHKHLHRLDIRPVATGLDRRRILVGIDFTIVVTVVAEQQLQVFHALGEILRREFHGIERRVVGQHPATQLRHITGLSCRI